MPELPEVQTIASDLQSLIGYKIEGIWSDWPKGQVYRYDPDKYLGKAILNVKRRSKYIVIELEGDLVIGIHLRMSGRLFIRHIGDSEDRFVHHVITLDQGTEVRFSDMRKFGQMWLSDQKHYQEDMGLLKLGLEPLDPDFTYAKFKQHFAAKKGTLKTKLLDQTLVTGIGNIYADETCFASGLHPESKLEKLSEQDFKNIHSNLVRILKYAVKSRGSSVGEFMDAYGRVGSAQKLHYAYRRRGEPCLVCNTKLKGIRVAQRGTSFCPSCQTLKA